MEKVQKKKLLLLIVAYNAEKTIKQVLERIPIELRDTYETEVLVIDDSSKDQTFEKAVFERDAGAFDFPLTVLFNPENQGYGGNQKIGYHYAIQNNFDYVAMIHGDGQYPPEMVPDLMKHFSGEVGAVFGSRMMEKRRALKGGMPFYKYVGNQILTKTQNLLFNTSLTEFHSGFRIYSVKSLSRIPFYLNSNDFHFDTEIIIQLFFAKIPIREHSIPTFYGDEVCHVNGFKYAKDVIVQSILAKLQRFRIFYNAKYDCYHKDQNTLHIQSKRLELNTPEKFLLQQLTEPKKLLLIGNDAEKLHEKLISKGKEVTYISNAEYLAMIQQEPSESYDAFVFIEGVEVFANPLDILLLTNRYLGNKPDTALYIITSNVAFITVRLMLLLGHFNYGKRGILRHQSQRLFTRKNLKSMLNQSGFDTQFIKGFPAPFALTIRQRFIYALLSTINQWGIAIFKDAFAFQFLFQVKPRKSLQSLLEDAYYSSENREKQETHLGKKT